MAAQTAARNSAPWLRLALLATLLAAFALRAWRLDFQSFWSDEGISLARASLPLADLLAQMPVEHAPGYFVALHGWIARTGTHDYGLRFFSLWPSVLAVALLYRLAVDLARGGGRPSAASHATGLIAAALMATNAFQIWYAQEARMYAWLLACSLLCTWAFWRILTGPHAQAWGFMPLYALSAAACVYLHYFGALVPIAHALYAAGWTPATRRVRPAALWLASAAGALLLFAPWLPRALAIFGFEGWRAPGDPAEIPLRYLRAYTVGDAMPAPLAAWLPWLYLGLALLGALWWLAGSRRRAGGLLLLVLLLFPFAAVLLLALRSPDYHERYAIALSAPLLLLAAAGLVALAPDAWRAAPPAPPSAARRRRVGRAAWLAPGLAALLLAAANGAALARQATDSTLHKPDFRAAAARIAREQRPSDVVLVDGPDPQIVFLHYYDGGLPVHDLRGLQDADAATVAARLESATAGADRAWELLYFHPPAAVQVWLATQAWAAEPSGHNGIRLTPYAINPGAGDTIPHDLAFGSALTLRTSTVGPGTVTAGEILRVTTDWFTNEPPPDLKFSLRLADASGQVAYAQDYVPQNWFAPTSVWVVGHPARDQHGILIGPELAPDRYTVTLRLYDASNGVAVETAAGTDIPLGSVTVHAADGHAQEAAP